MFSCCKDTNNIQYDCIPGKKYPTVAWLSAYKKMLTLSMRRAKRGVVCRCFFKTEGWLYHIVTRPGLVLLYMLHFDILILLLLDFAILAFLFLSCSIFTNLHDLTSASALASNLSRSGVPFLPITSSKTSSSVYVFMSR